jgi:hypothetical protein
MSIVARQQQVEEIMKCGNDPSYFMINYVKIQHPVRGRIDFQLYDFQKDCLNDFLNYRFNIINKSRQLGLSTLMAAFCLWMAVFRRDKNILIMATKLEVGKGAIAKIRVMFAGLPTWMKKMLNLEDPAGESVKYIKFTNGSRIEAIPTAEDSGRSESVSLMLIDELAYISEIRSLWAGLWGVVSTGGRIIACSTPSGKNFFYDLWRKAEERKNSPVFNPQEDFNPIKLPWYVHPERDKRWYDAQCKSLDERGVASEMNCCFEGSSNTFFPQSVIDATKNGIVMPIDQQSVTKDPSARDFWIWKHPVPFHKYTANSDVSRGDAEDYSAFCVIDLDENEIVAEYRGKVPPDRLGEILINVGQKYNNAQIIQEKNTFGVAVAIKLKDKAYPNLYYENVDKDEYTFLSEEEKSELLCGFTISPKNREEVLSNLEEVVRNRRIRIYSSRFVEEMETFVWTGKRGQALKGKHDDLIAATAIGCYVHKPTGTTTQAVVDSSAWAMAFLKGISHSSKTMGAVGPTPTDAITAFLEKQPQQNKFRARPEQFEGKPLPWGVRGADVQQHMDVYRGFDWLLDKK